MIVVCASARPRSAIISTRSRRLSLNRRYHRTHTMMTSRSKWRPSNNSSMLFSLLIADLQRVQLARVADRAGGFAPEPASGGAMLLALIYLTEMVRFVSFGHAQSLPMAFQVKDSKPLSIRLSNVCLQRMQS